MQIMVPSNYVKQEKIRSSHAMSKIVIIINATPSHSVK